MWRASLRLSNTPLCRDNERLLRLPLPGFAGDRFSASPLRHVGGLMSSQDAIAETGRVRLNDEDIAYLMNLLRNASQPVTTQQLIDALRRQSSQFHASSGSEGA
jgi:hypothetical protein